MTVKSEKQSSKLCEPSAESHSGPLQLNPGNSGNIESSHQIFETLEEWNDYLDRYSAPSTGAAILSARRCRVSTGFPGSFRLYFDESSHQVSLQS